LCVQDVDLGSRQGDQQHASNVTDDAARSLLARHEGGGVELAAAMNLLNDGVEQLKKVNAHLTTARRDDQHSAHVAQQTTACRCQAPGRH